mmetsp:Transcript_96071/g.256713  ORF Transcript_96071/g.256713 Transcript_96071/m.256713 type:complete len:273 (-) Transcript_96071:5-823(-)
MRFRTRTPTSDTEAWRPTLRQWDHWNWGPAVSAHSSITTAVAPCVAGSPARTTTAQFSKVHLRNTTLPVTSRHPSGDPRARPWITAGFPARPVAWIAVVVSLPCSPTTRAPRGTATGPSWVTSVSSVTVLAPDASAAGRVGQCRGTATCPRNPRTSSTRPSWRSGVRRSAKAASAHTSGSSARGPSTTAGLRAGGAAPSEVTGALRPRRRRVLVLASGACAGATGGTGTGRMRRAVLSVVSLPARRSIASRPRAFTASRPGVGVAADMADQG